MSAQAHTNTHVYNLCRVSTFASVSSRVSVLAWVLCRMSTLASVGDCASPVPDINAFAGELLWGRLPRGFCSGDSGRGSRHRQRCALPHASKKLSELAIAGTRATDTDALVARLTWEGCSGNVSAPTSGGGNAGGGMLRREKSGQDVAAAGKASHARAWLPCILKQRGGGG